MKEPIPIDDSMSEGLKNAISYLNEKNISLTDKIDVQFDTEDDEEDGFALAGALPADEHGAERICGV